MPAVPGRMNGDDAPLAQALDSFDQLTLCRDRQRRRVTEEENAVRALEELLTEKQRESELLAREADSRAAELAALERRVPALEETSRGARCSLQMLTQMRDMLSQQLNTEKRKTEDMLKTLDDQMEEAAARWNEYEAIYLTMPAYQRKLEMDALVAEERELNERKQQLEAELKSRVSDRDFCVRLAEHCLQARLLRGAIASRGGDSGAGGGQSPDGENMSSACSQGFGTPRASQTPSPVSDMETSQEPDGGESQPEAAGDPAVAVERTAVSAGLPTERGQRPPEDPSPPLVAGRSGDQERQPPGRVGMPTGSCWDAGAGPSTPQKRPSPPSSWREAASPETPSQQGGVRLQPPLQARSALQSPFQIGVTPQQDQPSPQSQLQNRGRPQPSLQNTESQQSPAQDRSPSQTRAGPPSQTAPSPEKAGWSPTGPREPAASPRRPPSFLIQMPSLYRPSCARAGGSSDTQVSHRPAAPAPPPVSAPPQHRPTQPPLPLPPPYQQQQQQQRQQQQQWQQQPPATTQSMTATTQDVEMMDIQENQQSPVRQPPGGQPRGAGPGSSPSRSDGRTSQQDRSAGGASPSRQPPAAEGRPTQSPTTGQHQPPVPAAAAAEQGTPRAPTSRQYWLPMPPETPPPPPMDERRSFVQQLRQSPELLRRPPPVTRPAAPPAAPPPESRLEHQFMRPALPPPRRPVPAAGSTQSIFDTPRRPPVEPTSPQRPPVGSPSREAARTAASPSTPRPPTPAAPAEPATPVRSVAAAGDAPRSMAAIFTSPEVDVGQLDSSFSLFGGSAAKEASPQPPPPSSMSLFGAGDVGGDGDQGGDDFSFSFFGGGGGAPGAEKEAPGAGGGGGVFSFF